MNTKKTKVILVVLTIVGLFAIDRYLFMGGRIVDSNWSFESGHYIQDPIHFGQHCELKDDKVFFYETKEELSVLGCYLGQLILYDKKTKDWTRYSKL